MSQGARPLPPVLCAIALSIIAGACSVSRYVPADRRLITSTEVVVEAADEDVDPDEVQAELMPFAPETTAGNVALYWHYKYAAPDSVKGVKPWLGRTLGTEPTYLDDEEVELSKAVMADYLKDHGYFGATIEEEVLTPDSTTAEVVYTVQVGGRSRIDTVYYPDRETEFGGFLDTVRATSGVQPGTPYSIAALGAERTRLDQLSSRTGFYAFAPNNVFYFVDSTAGREAVDVYLRLERGRDSFAFARHLIGQTYVYPSFSLGDSVNVPMDTTSFGSIHVIQPAEDALHPAVVARRVGLRAGELYDRRIYDNTINQFLDLGVFKFVNYEFERRLRDSTPILDQQIYLTQGLSQDFSASVEGTTQNAGGFGLGAGVSYRNRNIFNGGEDLTLSLSGRGGPQPSLYSQDSTAFVSEFEFGAQLSLPRFVGPFARELERRAFYIPRTLAELRYQVTVRPEFRLQKATLRFGYSYRANKYVTHELFPVSVDYTAVLNAEARFERLLEDNERLALSLSDQAIIGLDYQYTYNDQNVSEPDDFWTITGGVRTSGGVASFFAQEPSEPGGPKEIGGVGLSQFLKGFGDVRRTWLEERTSLATRFYGGIAYPYGDSRAIPFVEQFFAGGPNSMRAFQLRGLGPGAQIPAGSAEDRAIARAMGDSTSSNALLNQTGDIRLELNAEYRFDLFPFVEGAVFTDVGNVWLVNDITSLEPDGVFELDQFYRQLAVGAGFGIRLDFDIILLRFDASAPIRKPWPKISTADGQITRVDRGWELENLNIFNGDNFDENFQLHIAIGYPF